MSRNYEASIIVKLTDGNKQNAFSVQKALTVSTIDFDFTICTYREEPAIIVTARGEGPLYSGTQPFDAASDLVRRVWEATNKYYPATVVMTRLEDLPCDEYAFDDTDYKRWFT